MNEVVDFLGLVVTAMVPFILVSQGTMLGGRAGIFNVSQEGMMVLGAAVGFLVSMKVGSNAVGLLAAALAGAIFGLVLGWTTTRLRLDQFVIGLKRDEALKALIQFDKDKDGYLGLNELEMTYNPTRTWRIKTHPPPRRSATGGWPRCSSRHVSANLSTSPICAITS